MNRSVEDILLHGEISVEGRLVDASNATLFCEIHLDKEQIKAIYKPISGERPLWDFASGNLASRERAAYLVNQAMGFKSVPMTILRDGPFGIGMVQEWIEIDEDIDLALFFRENRSDLREIALFDAVVNNTDRKIGHLLPHRNGDLFICDHGVTFHEDDKLRTVLWQWAGELLTSDEMENLIQLKAKISEGSISELSELISLGEIEALISRIARLLDSKQMPSPSDDWPSVPWPPF